MSRSDSIQRGGLKKVQLEVGKEKHLTGEKGRQVELAERGIGDITGEIY